MKKFFLLGMPGCGKTTLGKQLADHLRLPFIDLDDEIATYCNSSINDIFKFHGEDYFRETEQKMLKGHTESHEAFVMSTGGGVPYFFDNMTFMNLHGITIFLDVPVEELFRRLYDQSAHRPLLKDKTEHELKTELHNKLNRRKPYYTKSNVVLKGDNIQLETLLKHIN